MDPILFRNAARQAGITFALNNYETEEKRMIETMPGGAATFDYNNDGLLDIYFTNGASIPAMKKDDPKLFNREKYYQQRLLFRNLGNGTFADVSSGSGPGILQEKCSRGLAIGDIDNDGDVDAIIVNIDSTPSILRNDRGNAQNWLTLRLVGTVSNRLGLGARVKATAGKLLQIAEATTSGSIFSTSDSRVHFGLGNAAQADLEIRWPSGWVQSLPGVRANRTVVIDEDRGMSGVTTPH